MKQFLAMALAVLFLTGCTARSAPSTPSAASEAPPQSESQPAPAASEPAPESDGEDALYEKILLIYGAEQGTDNHGRPCMVPTPISLYYADDGWENPAELQPGDYFSWFFSSTMGDSIPHDREQYKTESGEGFLYPQDIYEEIVQRCFDVTVEHLRSDPQYYDAARGGYTVDGGGGIGERPPVTLERTERDGDLLKLYFTITPRFDSTLKGALTVRLGENDMFRFERYEVMERIPVVQPSYKNTAGKVLPADDAHFAFSAAASGGTGAELNAWFDAVDSGAVPGFLYASNGGAESFDLSEGAIGAVMTMLQNARPVVGDAPKATQTIAGWNLVALDKDEKLLWHAALDGAKLTIEQGGATRIYDASGEENGLWLVADYLQK